ncbi:hypothetical protein ASE12_13080 [Aeromicrobium sp. Root236]|uniref:hypothetical protein n=1 Tax=Aeromicrobium sp. Root236 TaxID=1736498 RepID=UPI0006FBC5C5|nr:hypothetical protein [Aeromicrobium sp. Root236]KRC65606.1 hypothetical protein ASE12_13080 [Aeromicrobium sp. Root236]
MTNIIERLAPGPAVPDPVWAQTTLQRIRASKVPRRRRRRFIVTGVIAGAVLGGSIATAQGVPGRVLESIGLSAARPNLKLSTKPVKIADIHLSDGTRWQVWRALNDHRGSCLTAGDPGKMKLDPNDVLGSPGASCNWLPDQSELPPGWKVGESDDPESNFARLGFYGDDERKGIPLVYGQVVQPEVKVVRVVGPDYVKTVKFDPVTGGFGAQLPFRLAHLKAGYLYDGVHVEFLDGDGDIVN